jgi:L-asparaginase/Glu-tRNA(Gln) amidotransferase subunit D
MHVAVTDLSGVSLVFGNQVHRALEISPNRTPNLNYFHSISGKIFGKIDFGLKFFPPVNGRHQKKFKPTLEFESDIVSLEVNPSSLPEQIKQLAVKNPKALIVKLADLMVIPKSINLELIKLQKQRIPIIVFQEYQSGKMRSPFIYLTGIPYHTAYVFALWALGQSKNVSVIRKLLQNKVNQALWKGGA